LTLRGLERVEIQPCAGDVLVCTSKLLSRAEGRWQDVSRVRPSERARELAVRVGKDPEVVELILRESLAVSRAAPGVLVVRHRLGFVAANAAIDFSNALPPDAGPDSGPWALLLPEDPDRSAESLRVRLRRATGVDLGVVVSDSLGRPFRVGTVGAAVGAAGLPAVVDQVGRVDLDGRPLQYTVTALADQVAAMADLVAGQANEGRPLVHVRGLHFQARETSARELVRPAEQDLFA